MSQPNLLASDATNPELETLKNLLLSVRGTLITLDHFQDEFFGAQFGFRADRMNPTQPMRAPPKIVAAGPAAEAILSIMNGANDDMFVLSQIFSRVEKQIDEISAIQSTREQQTLEQQALEQQALEQG